jgi:hypothetical protein
MLQVLEVFSPPGHRIGTVEQTWSLCTPEFDVKNESGQCVLKIEGPACRYGICGNVEFKVSVVYCVVSEYTSSINLFAFQRTSYVLL